MSSTSKNQFASHSMLILCFEFYGVPPALVSSPKQVWVVNPKEKLQPRVWNEEDRIVVIKAGERSGAGITLGVVP